MVPANEWLFMMKKKLNDYLDPAGAVGGASAPKRARVNITHGLA